MSTIPIVPLKRVERAEHGDTAELWIIDCPYCGREHAHGAAVGHRVSHCQGPDTDPGYVLVRWADDDLPFAAFDDEGDAA